MMPLAKTPPMGWNSWNTFGWNISEGLIKETAQAFEDRGLKAAGYEYLVLDDCWSLRQRNADGKLVADPEKFPNGMKALSDCLHGRELKFGLYSCAGVLTCAEYPGSFEHEFADAQTFAEWGVDFLKYDYCNRPLNHDGKILYRRMAMALRNCGRDILFSACNWGHHEVEKWIRSSGAHMWRSTGDIVDNWESVKSIAKSQIGKECHGAPYCHNDMDMLVVGMRDNGTFVGGGGCTDEQYRTHFSLWCMMNSPLMIGCDVRNMSDEAQAILTNAELIALNQDPEGRQPYVTRHWDWDDAGAHTFVKPLHDGSYAIGLFNLDDMSTKASVQFWDMGLPVASGYGFKLRDLWAREEVGVVKEGMNMQIDAYSCKVYRAELVKV
ncbi:MAG: glycoside hydrolase family 27 protein [Oscillospiraceae bacterium]|nr:glycoside hydrolase family 27 protein [Oscillospiraceae bacterium]